MTSTDQTTPLPASSKVLCTVYAVIAIAALVATWSQNVGYLDRGADFLAAFWEDTEVNPASRSITVDIALFLLAAAVLMVVEARKHGVKFVWLYIIGGFLIAISVTFPLFLIARELRVGSTIPGHLSTVDTVGLAVLALFTAAFTIWVDVV
jgi:Terpene cyclase DEP1